MSIVLTYKCPNCGARLYDYLAMILHLDIAVIGILIKRVITQRPVIRDGKCALCGTEWNGTGDTA